MSDNDVRAALATLVADEPDLPAGASDIEWRGRRLLAGRRIRIAAVALAGVALAGAAGLLWPGVGPAATDTKSVTAADRPTDANDPGGSQLAQGFTVDSAVTAVSGALPAGVSIGDLPMDIGWRPGGTLDIPLANNAGTLTVTVSNGACAASLTSTALGAGQLGAVADAVCAAWRAQGSPEIIPAGAPGPEQPELANQ